MPVPAKPTMPALVAALIFSGMLFVGVPTNAPAQTTSVKVALCQIFCLDGDASGNLVRIEHAIIEAKEAGAAIACFPETSIFGWVNPVAHQRARPIPGFYSDRLCALAKEHQIHVCIGLAEKDGDNLHDSALLIDDTGRILLKHRKINILTRLMTPPYTPGSDVIVVPTRFGRIGVLICADTFREDVLERMAALRPDLLLVPYGWAASEDEWPDHGRKLHEVVKHTAEKTGAAVVGTDLVGQISHGPWTGQVYGGQSIAVNKDGTVLTIGLDRDRDIKTVDVPLATNAAAEDRN